MLLSFAALFELRRPLWPSCRASVVSALELYENFGVTHPVELLINL